MFCVQQLFRRRTRRYRGLRKCLQQQRCETNRNPRENTWRVYPSCAEKDAGVSPFRSIALQIVPDSAKVADPLFALIAQETARLAFDK